MTDTIDLQNHSLVAISKESLNALRASLFRDLGGNAATYLQEAGYSGAAPVYEAFSSWVTARGGPPPADLALDDFASAMGEFFTASGWGTMGFSVGEGGLATVESSDWAEAVAGDGSQMSGCYFTSGVLADFFGRITEAPISVMETECRSMGAERCRFLIATPEKLQKVYDEMYGG
ncbi:MAG TPA: V4R domain-containing protein, partial [Gemmatimonadaceae bacterium]|nr:V4R domain-containing protein [Gemmatimonadaceae bacterium]